MNYKNLKRKINAYECDPANALEADNISLSYKGNVIIDNFNFKFKKNLVYGIIGPAGSGKSSLAAFFNGLSKSKNGNIFLFNGNKIVFFEKKIKNFKELRKTVGMVLQFPEYQLFKETVLADVCYGPKILGLDPELAEQKAKQQLKDLGIPESLFHVNPLSLSGGQKRKVALASILAIDPDIIIFDEPTIGLDPQSEAKVGELVKKLKTTGHTIIILSHNMNLVFELCDQILVLDKGVVTHTGKPYDIFLNDQIPVQKPHLIKFIQKLIDSSPAHSFLLDHKPKNIMELSKLLI